MIHHDLFQRISIFLMISASMHACVEAEETGVGHEIGRIQFGSCIQQDQGAPIFRTMLREKPELLLFLGD